VDKKISAVVVSYNCGKYIGQCLSSILKDNLVKEIVVVDNNSFDNTAEVVKGFPVKFYRLSRNMGFAYANNFGAKKTSGQYILFSNPDVLFLENAITKMAEVMGKNPDAGICVPQLYSGDGKSRDEFYYKFPELKVEFLRALKLDKFVDLYRLSLKRHPSQTGELQGWPSGSVLLVRREVFLEVGGWDENYGLFYEDVDLAWQIVRKYKILFVPEAEVLHYGGKSSDKILDKRNAMILVARFYFYRKNYGLVKSVIFFLLWCRKLLRYYLKYRISIFKPRKNFEKFLKTKEI